MNEEEFKKIEQVIINFKDDIKQEFRHQLGVQSETFQHKLDMVVEGHQMLSEKLDRVEVKLDKRIDCLEKKIDAIAADLTAHREDTEIHHPIYKVNED